MRSSKARRHCLHPMRKNFDLPDSTPFIPSQPTFPPWPVGWEPIMRAGASTDCRLLKTISNGWKKSWPATSPNSPIGMPCRTSPGFSKANRLNERRFLLERDVRLPLVLARHSAKTRKLPVPCALKKIKSTHDAFVHLNGPREAPQRETIEPQPPLAVLQKQER